MLLASSRSLFRPRATSPRLFQARPQPSSSPRSAGQQPARGAMTAAAVPQEATAPASTGSGLDLLAQKVDSREQSSTEGYDGRWETIWFAGLQPGQGWDKCTASPALRKLVESGALPTQGARCLVPGCGRGYDLPVFAGAGAAEVVGLEISPSAIREAEAHRAAWGLGDDVASRARFASGNFFEWQQGSQAVYDLGFDYTFGCAIHPSKRSEWAATWARLIKPGGELVAIVFPVNPTADPSMGPPFPVTPDLYRELLGGAGFTCVSCEPIPPELSLPGRAGMEYMSRWRR